MTARRPRRRRPLLRLLVLVALSCAAAVPGAGQAPPQPVPPGVPGVPGGSGEPGTPVAPGTAAAPVAPVAPPAAGAGVPYLYGATVAAPFYDAAGVVDPWAALARTPGIVMVRAYVAGYGGRPGEAFASPGATGDQGAFRVDGFETGDLAAPGVPLGVTALTAQDVEVATGGPPLGALASGLQIDLVERRGTNEWRASALGLGSAGALAASAPATGELASGQAAREDVRGNRVRDTGAFGVETGGPLRRDVLWGWGSVDGGSTALTAFGGQPLTSSDLSAAGKLDARLAAGNSATLSWNHFHRAGGGDGAGPERAPETTLERASHDEIWRLSDTAVASPTFYSLATAGFVAAGAADTPRGGLRAPIVVDAAGVAHGSWFADQERRTTGAAALDAARSAVFAGAAHELHLAAEGRRVQGADQEQTPAWAETVAGSGLDLPPGEDALYIWRDGATRTRIDRRSLWASDTVTWSRATATFGLRYDRQVPRDLASAVEGVPGDPFLGPVAFSGSDAAGIRWSSLVPRLGVTWAPLAAGRLVLRASLARFASQLGPAVAAQADPAAAATAVYFVPTLTPVADGAADPYGGRFWYADGFDPLLPSGVSPNAADPRLHPEITDEAVGGAEYAFDGDGAVGVQVTWRRVSGILEDRLLVRDAATGAVSAATSGDWVPAGAVAGTLPSGGPYDVPYYDLRPGLSPTGGTLLVNGDRRQRLLGATLEGHRRLGERWSLRGHLTWQEWTWQLGPDYRLHADPSPLLADGTYDGQPVAAAAPMGAGGGPPTYLDSRWTLYVSVAVQLPAGFSAAAALDGRQGFPLAYYRTVSRDAAGVATLRVSPYVDGLRSDDLASLDARLDKQIVWGDDLRFTVSLEALNLAASGQVLRRETDLGVSRANFVDEVVAPRLLRLGLRLQLR